MASDNRSVEPNPNRCDQRSSNHESTGDRHPARCDDLDRSKKFYGEGLGCPIDKDYPVFVSFKLGEGLSELGLYPWDALAQDAGVAPEGSGFRGVTLNYIVDTPLRVDDVLAMAAKAGGAIVRPGQGSQWGGYFGYFADPDGHLWKVAASA